MPPQTEAKLTSCAKEAIRQYIYKLLTLPGILISLGMFGLGFGINELAREKAYETAYERLEVRANNRLDSIDAHVARVVKQMDDSVGRIDERANRVTDDASRRFQEVSTTQNNVVMQSTIDAKLANSDFQRAAADSKNILKNLDADAAIGHNEVQKIRELTKTFAGLKQTDDLANALADNKNFQMAVATSVREDLGNPANGFVAKITTAPVFHQALRDFAAKDPEFGTNLMANPAAIRKLQDSQESKIVAVASFDAKSADPWKPNVEYAYSPNNRNKAKTFEGFGIAGVKQLETEGRFLVTLKNHDANMKYVVLTSTEEAFANIQATLQGPESFEIDTYGTFPDPNPKRFGIGFKKCWVNVVVIAIK